MAVAVGAAGTSCRDLGQQQEGGADILPAPRAYRDYLTWLTRQDADAARAYWRQRLAGAAALPEVLDRPPGKPQGMAERRLTLSEEMVAELRGFVRRHGLTLGTLIHAAWAVWCWRNIPVRKDVAGSSALGGRPAGRTRRHRAHGRAFHQHAAAARQT